jgi:pimeloyl-ACP methyl ester carboxylesterase
MPKIQVNGVNIHYEISGKGPALVLLHGWTENHKFWKLQIPEFSKNYKVIAIDLRGHGESDKPKTGYSIQTFADDLYHMLSELEIDKVVIAGHSMGGMTALVFCLTYPEKVKALILVNTTSAGIHDTAPISLSETLEMIRMSGFENVVEQFFAPTFFAPRTSEDLINWAKSEVLKTPQYAVEGALKAIMEHNVTEKLSKITVPTLIIHSTHDLAIGVQMAKILHEKIPISNLQIIDGAGHHTMLEKPDEFKHAVSDFLRKIQSL